MLETTKSMCMACGCRFTPNAINAVLGIPDVLPGRDEYRMFLNRDKDFDAILERVCILGTQWQLTRSGNCELSKKATYKVSRPWAYFIAARLMPVSHLSTLTY